MKQEERNKVKSKKTVQNSKEHRPIEEEKGRNAKEKQNERMKIRSNRKIKRSN